MFQTYLFPPTCSERVHRSQGWWNDRVQMTPHLFDPWIAGWHISLRTSSSWAGKNPQRKFKSRASVLGVTLDWDAVNCHMSPSTANWTVPNSPGKQAEGFIARDIRANSSTTVQSSTRKNPACLSSLGIWFCSTEFSYWQAEKEKEGLCFKTVLHNSLERMSSLSQSTSAKWTQPHGYFL